MTSFTNVSNHHEYNLVLKHHMFQGLHCLNFVCSSGFWYSVRSTASTGGVFAKRLRKPVLVELLLCLG